MIRSRRVRDRRSGPARSGTSVGNQDKTVWHYALEV